MINYKVPLRLLILLLTIVACKKQEQPASETSPALDEKKDRIVEMAAGQSKLEIKTSTGKSFLVETLADGSSVMNITISTLGYGENDQTWELEGTDPLTSSFVADLDSNGFDELYLITTSAGSGSYGTIYGYASNNDRSVTPIYIPGVSENDLNPGGSFAGYMGHDSIFMDGAVLKRVFPKYEEGDANCCPSGGKITIIYKLKAGEASWQLQATKQ
jgi:hypothetical protein